MSDTSASPDNAAMEPAAALDGVDGDGSASVGANMGKTPDPSAPGDAAWWSWPQRILLVTLAVAPAPFCFLFASNSGPQWQSGNLGDYAELLLSWRPSLPFFPLLLYCMVSFTLVVVKPDRFLPWAVTRLGVYTGVLLALQYVCVVSATFGVGDGVGYVGMSVIAAGVTLAVVLGLGAMGRRGGEEAACFMAVVIFVVLIFIPPINVLALIFAPSLTLTVFAATAVRIAINRKANRFQFSLAWLLGVVAWFAAYLGAWRWSILIMLDEYAKLPTEAPDCYVATAAARGHRRCVRVAACATAAGRLFWANDQMRRLKAFELVLARVCPAAHRACRGVYDRLGPALAAILVHPVLADAAYLALKPAEWTARIVLVLVLPRGAGVVDRLYR
ncbi:MAG: hypothetical protein JW809_05355 [Pirellulales bacterium]|nr:hypothetical protein [Pirellulales bacterium]